MKFLNSEWHWRSRKIIEALLFDCLSPQNQVSERIMNLEKGLEIVACWKEFKPEIQNFSFNIVPVKHGVVARASIDMLLCFHYNVSLLRSLFDGKGITESHFFFFFSVIMLSYILILFIILSFVTKRIFYCMSCSCAFIRCI